MAADLAIPYPDRERTFFRLVVGGHHEQVLDLSAKSNVGWLAKKQLRFGPPRNKIVRSNERATLT